MRPRPLRLVVVVALRLLLRVALTRRLLLAVRERVLRLQMQMQGVQGFGGEMPSLAGQAKLQLACQLQGQLTWGLRQPQRRNGGQNGRRLQHGQMTPVESR